jgi:hypothetical protein
VSGQGSQDLAISHGDLAGLVSEVVGRGGSLGFVAQGRSMWPFLRPGDYLVVEAASDRVAARGDVLLYRAGTDRLVAHRVTGRKGDLLVLQGDRLWAAPEWVRPEQVLGRVVAVARGGRRRAVAGPVLQLLALAWIALRPWLCELRRRLSRRRPTR